MTTTTDPLTRLNTSRRAAAELAVPTGSASTAVRIAAQSLFPTLLLLDWIDDVRA
jgi:hypothetical protein